jgi:hypothetical protein
LALQNSLSSFAPSALEQTKTFTQNEVESILFERIAMFVQSKQYPSAWNYLCSSFDRAKFLISTFPSQENLCKVVIDFMSRFMVTSWLSNDLSFSFPEFFNVSQPHALLINAITKTDQKQRKQIFVRFSRYLIRVLKEQTTSKSLTDNPPSQHLQRFINMVNWDVSMLTTLGDLLFDESKPTFVLDGRNLEMSSILLPFLSPSVLLNVSDNSSMFVYVFFFF